MLLAVQEGDPARSEPVKICSFEQYLRSLRGIENQNDRQNEVFDSPVKVIFGHQQNPLQSASIEVVGLNSRLKLKVVFTNATELIARWDNAPHWMEIETYPHHKHLGEEGRVVASEATTLEEILAVIRPAI